VPTPLLPIKHYPQTAEAGCLAACAQMILASLDVTVTQDELNLLFDLTPMGVPLSRLTRLKKYNIQVSIRKTGSLDDLHRSIDQNDPALIFVHTGQLSYWGIATQHAVVIIGYDGPNLLINDPAFPDAPQSVDANELILAWDEFDNTYAILTK